MLTYFMFTQSYLCIRFHLPDCLTIFVCYRGFTFLLWSALDLEFYNQPKDKSVLPVKTFNCAMLFLHLYQHIEVEKHVKLP